ncbi:sulfite exporter TauE/SafE family protein [Acidovorax cavernicola]|uniref:Probable membrane transporter protein n=1 Tax=Acidovorax cavernicola TaxID=1675792 RepID=A0A9X8D2X4_9BURK|nr:sulfite exporter TauE/SafE family protein [Acidovorax cavernicola]RIX77243.1 sulfite exporter TauE/SafE family protein [Acidovorax cavernicola]
MAEAQTLLTEHRRRAKASRSSLKASVSMEFLVSLYLLLVVCGCLTGVTTVLFGFGGGFVVVPLLYQLLSQLNAADSAVGQSAMQIAVATSTCVMIFGALLATWRHQRAGTLDWSQVRPLLGAMGAGGVLGALAATAVHGEWLRWAFAAYLALTILDCWLRPGFLAPPAVRKALPSPAAMVLSGLVIGGVAAFLGVGGSVMTVPLMRRRGIEMTRATAMANPLSLPVALAGTATYVVLSTTSTPSFGPGHLGYVDVRAAAMLVVGSCIGIRIAGLWIGRIPDRIHARVYLALLVTVLLAMVVR